MSLTLSLLHHSPSLVTPLVLSSLSQSPISVASTANSRMEIVKGKRTKRPRTNFPADGSGCSYPIPSPELSDEISASTEEEEDMANCLILLARGTFPKPVEEDDSKISRKRLMEMESVTTGRSGFYVYECKTCNRTFPSFQALGGHRASHRKPRTAMADAEGKEEREREGGGVEGQFGNFAPPTLSLHLTAAVKPAPSPHVNTNGKASKMHECSICGSEFSSGQALGGHMRRHRAPPLVKSAAASNSGDGSSGESPEENVHDHKPINILSFDLNLPAPTEDDQDQITDSKFEFRANKHLVFSAPPLVDCHY